MQLKTAGVKWKDVTKHEGFFSTVKKLKTPSYSEIWLEHFRTLN